MKPFRNVSLLLLAALPGVSSGASLVHGQAAEPKWAWRLADRPRIDLGGETADSNTAFSRVQAAFRLRDGRIAIAEFNSPPAIRYFSAEGRYLMQIGRSGGGPGEFRAIAAVFRTPEDSLIVYDPWQGRLTYLTPSGKVGRQVSRAGSGLSGASMRQVLVGRFADGTFLARNNVVGRADIGPPRRFQTGPRRDSIPWLRLREDGSIIDTLVRAPGEVYESPNANIFRIFRFTPRPAVLAAGDRFYLGTGEQYRITEFDLRGRPLLAFTKATRHVKVTSADLTKLEEEMLNALPAGMQTAQARTQFREQPSMETMPAHDRFLLRDPEGNLWVLDFAVPGAPRATWSVFAKEGRFRGTVHLPPGFRLLDVGSDYVLGSWPDEGGALHVQLIDLLKGAA
jgi:hypothetical protein